MKVSQYKRDEKTDQLLGMWDLRTVRKKLPFFQHREWVVYRCCNELFSFIFSFIDLFHNHVSLAILVVLVILNLFQIKALFLYHRKTSQNLWFYGIYWECKKGTLEYEKFNLSSNKFSSKIKLNKKTGNLKYATTKCFFYQLLHTACVTLRAEFFRGNLISRDIRGRSFAGI